MVTPEYFDTVRHPHDARAHLHRTGPRRQLPVAIVNETFVAATCAGVDPLPRGWSIPLLHPGSGRTAPPSNGRSWASSPTSAAGAQRTTGPEIEVPFWQRPWPSARVAIGTRGDPSEIRRSVEAIVRALDPELPIAEVKTMEQMVYESMAGDRFTTFLFGASGSSRWCWRRSACSAYVVHRGSAHA